MDDVVPAPERFEAIAATYRDRSGVVRSALEGSEVLTVNGEVFAELTGDRLTVCLPSRDPGSSWEWKSIGSAPTWRELADDAYREMATWTGATKQPGVADVDPHDMAELVAAAFDVGRPDGPMTAGIKSSQETWRLDTCTGSYLVKRFWRGPDVPWRTSLQRAMEFEAVALRAGIDSPAPIVPRDPQFAAAAAIDGLGVFRAYPYLEHRPLDADDDVTDWYASTLARIQQLEPPLIDAPAPTWFYNQFPPVPPGSWEQWAVQGRRAGRPWAGALAQRADMLTDLTDRVVTAFAAGAPWVMTHRDVETWNILMAADGGGWRPVLVDWDVAGPDSAALEAAHVLVEYARFGRRSPDPDRLRRGIDVYRSEGGVELDQERDILARRLGMRIAHIAGRIRGSLDAETDEARSRADAAVADYLDGLPDFVAAVGDRARLF